MNCSLLYCLDHVVPASLYLQHRLNSWICRCNLHEGDTMENCSVWLALVLSGWQPQRGMSVYAVGDRNIYENRSEVVDKVFPNWLCLLILPQGVERDMRWTSCVLSGGRTNNVPPGMLPNSCQHVSANVLQVRSDGEEKKKSDSSNFQKGQNQDEQIFFLSDFSKGKISTPTGRICSSFRDICLTDTEICITLC